MLDCQSISYRLFREFQHTYRVLERNFFSCLLCFSDQCRVRRHRAETVPSHVDRLNQPID